MRLTLKIHVDYDATLEEEQELARQLHRCAEHLLDSGMLKGNGGADVMECTHEVELVCHRCPCGSGLESEWQCDARGIELCRTCPQSHQEAMSRYRLDVLTHPNYEADEPCEQLDRL